MDHTLMCVFSLVAVIYILYLKRELKKIKLRLMIIESFLEIPEPEGDNDGC